MQYIISRFQKCCKSKLSIFVERKFAKPKTTNSLFYLVRMFFTDLFTDIYVLRVNTYKFLNNNNFLEAFQSHKLCFCLLLL